MKQRAMKQKTTIRRGFATVVAMVSLMLVGITVAVLTARMAMIARRSNAETQRAQHEQITIAASMDRSVVLPDELR